MKENTQFVKDCQAALQQHTVRRGYLSFEELFNLKYPVEVREKPEAMFLWSKFDIYAYTKKDFKMSVWNGHGAKPEYTEHICPAGTKVRIWMVSRMGDIGITDNLDSPKGYDCRGVDNEDLYDWEVVRNRA